MKIAIRFIRLSALAVVLTIPTGASAKSMFGYCIDGNSYRDKSTFFEIAVSTDYPDEFISQKFTNAEAERNGVFYDRALNEEWEAEMKRFYRGASRMNLGFCYVFSDRAKAEAVYHAYGGKDAARVVIPFSPASPRSAKPEAQRVPSSPSVPPSPSPSLPSLVVKDTSLIGGTASQTKETPPAPSHNDQNAQRQAAEAAAKAAASTARADAAYQAELAKFFAELRRRGRAQ